MHTTKKTSETIPYERTAKSVKALLILGKLRPSLFSPPRPLLEQGSRHLLIGPCYRPRLRWSISKHISVEGKSTIPQTRVSSITHPLLLYSVEPLPLFTLRHLSPHGRDERLCQTQRRRSAHVHRSVQWGWDLIFGFFCPPPL